MHVIPLVALATPVTGPVDGAAAGALTTTVHLGPRVPCNLLVLMHGGAYALERCKVTSGLQVQYLRIPVTARVTRPPAWASD